MADREQMRPIESTDSAGSLRRTALQWMATTGILLFSMALVLQDLMGANRPHELHNAPWVAGITLLNLVLCTRVFAGLMRYSRACRPGSERGPAFYALALGLVVVAGLDALLLAAAGSTVPAVLGS
ncbi:MAG: hypothetical protein ACI8QC_004392 [Planctomycetota bacterium]|jgi:hypothetical protein